MWICFPTRMSLIFPGRSCRCWSVLDPSLLYRSGVGRGNSSGGQKIHLPHFIPVFYKKLQQNDGPVSGHLVRHQQFMAPRRTTQLLPHSDGDLFIDRNGTDIVAFPLDDDGVFPESPLCRGSVNAETLVDAKAVVPGQIEGQDEVIAILGKRLAQHLLKFRHAPSAVHAAESAPLQFHSQFLIVRQRILGPAHLIVEKLDGGTICLDRGGRLPALLHIEDITSQVLAADVFQFLKVVLICQKCTEPLACLVVALFGAEISLAVVAGQTVQLARQGTICTSVDDFISHNRSPAQRVRFCTFGWRMICSHRTEDV